MESSGSLRSPILTSYREMVGTRLAKQGRTYLPACPAGDAIYRCVWVQLESPFERSQGLRVLGARDDSAAHKSAGNGGSFQGPPSVSPSFEGETCPSEFRQHNGYLKKQGGARSGSLC